jgi:hypothetical protein
VGDISGDGCVLLEDDPDAGARHGVWAQVREVRAVVISMLPDGFYDKVKKSSVVFARYGSFGFCHDVLVLDSASTEKRIVPTDVVVLATGFRGDEKLRDMFASPQVKDIIAGSPDTAVLLYRECVHHGSRRWR